MLVTKDEKYMRRALELAKLGNGYVAPNPMVGAVIVHNDTIIGEGYHEKCGESHAEVNAIHSVERPELLSESTIYVTLEPCSHHGKTPPCSDLIIEKKLKRVVIGCRDSFAQVNGKGIEKLNTAGVEVSPFVLEEAARTLNKKFFTFQEKRRPFVLLKWAESTNGKIDSKKGGKDSITWLSKPETQPFVHQLRSEYAAILVGKNTVLNDNPSLTVRAVSGNQPLRIVLDSRCELKKDRNILNDGHPTYVLNTCKTEEIGNLSYLKIKSMTPKDILDALFSLHIQSVLIEGGAKTLQSFMDTQLWDEAIQIIGQSTIEDGTAAPHLSGQLIDEKSLCGDRIKLFRP